MLIKPIQLRDIYFNKVANILPQFVIWLITKLLIFWIELHKHPVLLLSVCAQVAKARALKEIIVSMNLRNGKNYETLCGNNYDRDVCSLFRRNWSYLGDFSELPRFSIYFAYIANRQRNSQTDNLLAASSPTESTNHVFLLHYKTVAVIETPRHL